MFWQSDQFIVLRGWESQLQGEGTNSNAQPEKETLTKQVGLEELMQTSLQGISKKAERVKKHRFQDLIGNYKSLNQFYYLTKRSLFKWLNRRSQRKSFNWEKFASIDKKIWNREAENNGKSGQTIKIQVSLCLIAEVSIIEEPCAVVPHAGICAGGIR